MAAPVIAQAAPFFVDVEEGRSYTWCACGRSKTQPYCDGSHAGSGIEPIVYRADATRRVMFCGCKASKKQPICDGTHNRI